MNNESGVCINKLFATKNVSNNATLMSNFWTCLCFMGIATKYTNSPMCCTEQGAKVSASGDKRGETLKAVNVNTKKLYHRK